MVGDVEDALTAVWPVAWGNHRFWNKTAATAGSDVCESQETVACHLAAFTVMSLVPGLGRQTDKVTIRQQGPQWVLIAFSKSLFLPLLTHSIGKIRLLSASSQELFSPEKSREDSLSLDALLVLEHIAVHEAIQHGGMGMDINVELQTNSLMEEKREQIEQRDREIERCTDRSNSPHQSFSTGIMGRPFFAVLLGWLAVKYGGWESAASSPRQPDGWSPRGEEQQQEKVEEEGKEGGWKEFQPTCQGLDEGNQPNNHLGLKDMMARKREKNKSRRI
ncbi:hypothetical protein FQN60_013024 [Etheostoma spectabile]|uniref:Uncharacterized protein n=1 Tax=Etheostoma spectabile TaxID=54343 RepID=A0A5J5D889_9PERO|nr:hypothetical protein FQN60_013024 [Etheostoma spectabile]